MYSAILPVGYNAGMTLDRWPISLGFFILGAIPILSILFPQMGLRWGTRHSRGNGPSMSLAGKISFGSMGLTAAVLALINDKTVVGIGIVIYIVALVMTGVFAFR